MPRLDVADDPYGWLTLQPDLAGGLMALNEAVYGKSRLPVRVREAARMRVAEANQCQLCRHTRAAPEQADDVDEALYAHVLDWRNWPGYSERERLAIEFAERFAQDHLGMTADDDFWRRLRANFDDAEIVDLSICCVLWIGAGRALRVLDVGQACALLLPVTSDQP